MKNIVKHPSKEELLGELSTCERVILKHILKE
jgi:hypothetical protein